MSKEKGKRTLVPESQMVLYSFGEWLTEEKEKGASIDSAPTMNQIKHDLLHHRIFTAALRCGCDPGSEEETKPRDLK